MRRWVGVGAAVVLLVVAGGGYALLLRSANEAVEGALAQFQAQLPPGGSLEYAGYEVDLLERSVVLEAPVLKLAGALGFSEISAARAVATGLEPDPDETRASLVRLTDIRVVDAADPQRVLTAASLEIENLRLPGHVADLQQALEAASLGEVRATDLGFAVPEADLSLGGLTLTGLQNGTLARFGLSDLAFDVREPAGDGRLTVGDFDLEGIHLRPLLRALSEPGQRRLPPTLAGEMMSGLRGMKLERMRLELGELPDPLELALASFADPQVFEGRLVGGRAEVRDLVLPLSGELTRPLRMFLPGVQLGDSVALSMTSSQSYDPAGGGLTLDHSLSVRDALDLSYSLALGEMAAPPHPGMSEIELQAALLGATLAEAEVVLRDRGFVRPLLEGLAAGAGQPVEAYVAGLVQQLRAGLALLRVGEPADAAVSAVRDFLTDPQALRITLDPERAVPLLLLAGAGSPRDAIALLRPQVTAAAD